MKISDELAKALLSGTANSYVKNGYLMGTVKIKMVDGAPVLRVHSPDGVKLASAKLTNFTLTPEGLLDEIIVDDMEVRTGVAIEGYSGPILYTGENITPQVLLHEFQVLVQYADAVDVPGLNKAIELLQKRCA